MGPTTRIPAACAASVISSWSAAPASPDSANPPVITMADFTFRPPSSRIVPGTSFAGMITTARSVPSGSSAADFTEGTPRITSPFGFTGTISPA